MIYEQCVTGTHDLQLHDAVRQARGLLSAYQLTHEEFGTFLLHKISERCQQLSLRIHELEEKERLGTSAIPLGEKRRRYTFQNKLDLVSEKLTLEVERLKLKMQFVVKDRRREYLDGQKMQN
jgi:hypothetical protein